MFDFQAPERGYSAEGSVGQKKAEKDEAKACCPIQAECLLHCPDRKCCR